MSEGAGSPDRRRIIGHVARLIRVVFVAAALCGTAAAQDALMVFVENELDFARQDEVVRISWEDVRSAVPAASVRTVRVVEAATGREAVSQTIDEDGDGMVDALLFLSSFWPGQARVFRVEAAPPAPFAPRVHVRHHAPRDDVAWENDRVAFRTYGEGLWELEDLVSSGFDAWTKRTRDLVVDRWYEDGHYHDDTGEGADFFIVGRTLGAGAPGLWSDGRLHRAPNFASHRILANGPIRSAVELEHGPFDAGGIEVRETRRITIDAGQPLFEVETTFSAAGAGDLKVAVGIVERAGEVRTADAGDAWQWLGLWGPVTPPGHGRLGVAVIIDAHAATEVAEGHYLALVDGGGPVVYYVATAWTAAGDVSSVEDWWAELDAAVRKLQSPIRVSLHRP